jgi:hypothetical protein
MRRSVIGLDRLLAIVVGLCLLVIGAAAVAWYAGWLAHAWPATPKRLSTAGAADVVDMSWWPWAAIGAGILAVILGLWWLIAHLPRRGVGMLVLPGSGKAGRLLVDPAGPANTAADVLAETPGIRSAHGKVLRDRGELVVAITGTVDPTADLREVLAAADTITTDLQSVLGRDDARARVRLAVARHHRAGSRSRVD